MQRLVWGLFLGAVAALGGCDDAGSEGAGLVGGTATSTGGSPGGGAAASAGGASAAGPIESTGGSVALGGVPAAAGSPETPASTCPPTGDLGTAEGDTLPDVTLYDCDGNPVSLYSLCDHEAAVVYTYAQWCPVCNSNLSANLPQDLYAKYAGEDFEMYFVVTEATGGGFGSPELCQAVRDSADLPMPVLYDPNGTMETELGVQANSGEVVLVRGMVIEHKSSFDFTGMTAEVAGIFGY